MNATLMMLDNPCPTQNPAVASGPCRSCRCKHGLPQDSPPVGRNPAAACPQPGPYIGSPPISPCPHDYRYTSNGNRYRIVRGRRMGVENHCFNPCCFSEPTPACPRPKYCETLLASVAETQLTLSRMLNAEAEKLDKAIEVACSSDQLLEINEAVHRTLTAVLFLEQALCCKLQQMKDMCGACQLDCLYTPPSIHEPSGFMRA